MHERAAGLAVVAAALSPWSFQVARLAVDAPMAPMLLVFAVYLFFRSPRAWWAAAAGVVIVLAAYTYPPVRVQAPLLVILLLVVERQRLDRARLGAFVGAMALTTAPLAILLVNGDLWRDPKRRGSSTRITSTPTGGSSPRRSS